jgi:hypothetical protein
LLAVTRNIRKCRLIFSAAGFEPTLLWACPMAAASSTSVEKAKACLAKAAPIPGWPLANMSKTALFNSKSDFDLLQNAIDYLTCKARLKMAFIDEEKGFLKAIYEDFAVGGRVKGYFRSRRTDRSLRRRQGREAADRRNGVPDFCHRPRHL